MNQLDMHFSSTGCSAFTCPDCHISFSMEASLLKHNVEAHKMGNGDMKCSQCSKEFTDHQTWIHHEAGHAKSRPYVCKICDHQFSSLKQLLESHLPKVHSVFPKLCHESSICKNRENVQNSLKVSKQKELPVEYCVYLDCELCGGKSTNQQALAIHKTHHFMQSKFSIRCSSCSEAFSSMTDLTSHVHQNKCMQYKCDECNQSYPTQHCFVTHKLQDHVPSGECGLYKCFFCSQTFSAHSDYVTHTMENHVTSKPFQCLICGTNFKSMVHLEGHLSEIHKLLKDSQEQGKYECSQCLSIFNSETAIQVHRFFHSYRERLKENRSDKQEMSFASYITTHFCKVCSIGFSTSVHLERHKQMHGKAPDKLRCPVCREVFLIKSRLMEHLAKHNKHFLCTECGKTFAKSSALRDHVLVYHSMKNPFQCSVCKKFYSSKHTLQRHMKSHIGDKRFECRLCGNKFTVSSALGSHMAMHSVKKMFKCEVCNYQSRHKAGLPQHKKTHYGVQLFVCPICERPFKQRFKMKAHLRSHTGEKKFKCDLCNKKFTRRNNLHTHALLHLNEKPFSCLLCSKSFAGASNLNSHVKKAHGDKAFKQFQEQRRLRQLQKESEKASSFSDSGFSKEMIYFKYP